MTELAIIEILSTIARQNEEIIRLLKIIVEAMAIKAKGEVGKEVTFTRSVGHAEGCSCLYCRTMGGR